MNISTAETDVARYMNGTTLPAGPLEVVTSEDPTACCINLLRAVHAAEEATQTARAANLADQAYRRAFGHGYHPEVPSAGIAPLGELSARQLLGIMTAG